MDRAVRIPRLIVALAVGFAFVAGLAAADRDGDKTPGFVPPSTRRGAADDAALVLRSVVLPVGAKRLSGEPSADGGVLAVSGPHEVYVDQVDRHAWWRVHGSSRSVVAFVHAHAPAGAREFTTGWGSASGRETSAFMVFGWPKSVGIRTRQLTVLVATTRSDTTYLRVDARVVWLLPRPPSERIPDGVQTIDIMWGLPGRAPSQSRTVRDAAGVKAIVAAINSLPTVQPGQLEGCNSAKPVGAEVPKITFTFRAGLGGAVLAVARESAEATEPAACDPMSLSIAGLPQRPLLEGPKVVAEAQRLLRAKS